MSTRERRIASRHAPRKLQIVAAAHALSALATDRDLSVRRVRESKDVELRHALSELVRRWSDMTPVLLTSDDARTQPKHREHVVPVRVLVDRMIMQPHQIERLLDECVVQAWVTGEEHERLPHDYEFMYEQMLPARSIVCQALHCIATTQPESRS